MIPLADFLTIVAIAALGAGLVCAAALLVCKGGLYSSGLSGCQRRKSRLRPLRWNPLNLIGVIPA